MENTDANKIKAAIKKGDDNKKKKKLDVRMGIEVGLKAELRFPGALRVVSLIMGGDDGGVGLVPTSGSINRHPRANFGRFSQQVETHSTVASPGALWGRTAVEGQSPHKLAPGAAPEAEPGSESDDEGETGARYGTVYRMFKGSLQQLAGGVDRYSELAGRTAARLAKSQSQGPAA
ncbi:hypothetical protein P280DRAFT_517264 [Massarina eburnea CBS 473.64]|uniref:Uncharacterized protein n=1 Tax=Massarina eburnea CBS 473.64 TaxID=1395130 RepID=A0A6A6RZM8_9PLEO|nr:hypothetical protein P280DRAFT_517264 [Massarina eburnea CBS 473.64]